MNYTLSEHYNTLYNEYINHEKNLVSQQGFISLKNRTRFVLKWFEKEKISPENATITDALLASGEFNHYESGENRQF